MWCTKFCVTLCFVLDIITDVYTQIIADKIEECLDEHDKEDERVHQGMVLAETREEANQFCVIYNKHHKSDKCKAYVSPHKHKIKKDFINGKIRTLVLASTLVEGFDHKPVSVLGVICKVSQIKFSQFVGQAVRKFDSKDPVKAHIVTHKQFNLHKTWKQYEKIAIEDPQGDIVSIYVLNDSLIEYAEIIKKCLESDDVIQMCHHASEGQFTYLQKISTSVSAAYQHYAQCTTRVSEQVSGITNLVSIKPFSDLVKLMPQSPPEFSKSKEFSVEEELLTKLSQLSEEYQMEVLLS